MKKSLLLTSISTVNILTAQIVAKDNTFANNGKFLITSSVSSVNDVYGSRMVQDQLGNIYFTTLNADSSTVYNQTILSKISSAGIVDTSFGINGKTVVDSHANPDSNLQMQPDGKPLMIGFHSGIGSDINTHVDIVRFLPNGQLDPSFGTGGIASFANVSCNHDRRYYGLFRQGGKIIFYGEALSGNSFLNKRIIYRLNNDGTPDSTFGNGGTVNTQGRFVFQDSLNNIISFTSGTPTTGSVEKFNSNGQVVTNFGNNGLVNLTFDPGPIASAYLDSSNNILYSNMNGEIGRIRPDGTKDTSFVFDPSALPFSVIVFSIVEKDGFYYIGGMNTTNNEFFISKLEQNGSINSAFGYFVETDPDLLSAGDLIINSDHIIANGNGYMSKYHTNTSPTLSAVDPESDIKIVFQNPIKDYLLYSTDQKVSYIDVYSLDGKLVKTLINGNKHISDLPKGAYFIKVTTEGGITVTKKLIKN